MTRNFKEPPAIHVYVTVKPTPQNGLIAEATSRIGTCARIDQVPALVAKDRANMNESYGGLIAAPGAAARTYRAFRAAWTEIPIPRRTRK